MSYHVLLMRQQDVAQVTEIDREAFSAMMPPVNFQRELGNKLAHYIVAYDDAKTSGESGEEEAGHYVAGFAGFWLMAGEAHIVNIAVRQPYRRRGIGELLLISLIDLALETKANLVTLEVRLQILLPRAFIINTALPLPGCVAATIRTIKKMP